MDERVIETLATVGLTFIGSIIIMFVGNWLQAWREDHRVSDQRRYERVRDRVDKIEPHVVQLNLALTEVTAVAERVIELMVLEAKKRGSEISEGLAAALEQNLKALEQALEKARALREEGPGIIINSLEPQILDMLDELYESLNRLYLVCRLYLFEMGGMVASQDVKSIEAWAEEWRGQILTEHAVFRARYKTLVHSLGNLLEHGYPRLSWVGRLREWWEGRGGAVHSA